MKELMTRKQYAAHQGVAPASVSKAIVSGRISDAVVRDEHGRVAGIKWELADKLWLENTCPERALLNRAARPGKKKLQAAAKAQREISKLLGQIFGYCGVGLAGIIAARNGLSAEAALGVVEDTLLVLNIVACERLGVAAADGELLLDGGLALAFSKKERPAVIKRVAEIAENFDARDAG